ncbi:MAG: hypothetical protein ACR2OZ_16810 [Verrucomicrobiales bacterium]
MKRRSSSWLFANVCAALGLSGCIEIEQHIVLNPDGSGKVQMASAIAIPDFGALAGGVDPSLKADPKKAARDLAVSMLRSDGIEAWSDVKYEIGKDGKSRASAIGYFPDVTKVKINSQMGDDQQKQNLVIKKDGEGNWVFEMSPVPESTQKSGDQDEQKDKSGDSIEKQDESKSEEAAQLSDEDVETKLLQERQQWAAMKSFMGAIFDGMKARFSLEGGGTIVGTTVFKKDSDSKASFQFEGKDMIKMIDQILQDDENAKKLIREGKSPTAGAGGPEAGFSALFGEAAPRVVMKPGAAAFDYKGDVAKAKASQPAELKAMLAEAEKPPKKSGDQPSLKEPGVEEDGAGKPEKRSKTERRRID